MNTITFRLDDGVRESGASIELADQSHQCFNCARWLIEGDYLFRAGSGRAYHVHCAISGGALIPYYDDQETPGPNADSSRQSESGATTPAHEEVTPRDTTRDGRGAGAVRTTTDSRRAAESHETGVPPRRCPSTTTDTEKAPSRANG